MPTARNYNPGSIVYFQGDLGDAVYVIKKGRIVLISSAYNTENDLKEEIVQGEFFGVRSCLGRFPREETAQAIGKATIIEFTIAEFEKYAERNPQLILKMLQVFSHQLRTIHQEVLTLLESNHNQNPAFELLRIAESYYKNHHFDYAIYAFEKYLEHYKDGTNRKRAQELLQSAKVGENYPESLPEPASEFGGGVDPNAKFGQKQLEELVGDFGNESHTPNSSENSESEEKSEIIILFRDAKKAIEEENYEKAASLLEQCFKQKKFKNQEEKDMLQNAFFEMGHVKLKMKNLDEAYQFFLSYLKKFSSGIHVKDSLYQMGVIQEFQGKFNQARSLYHKVATMLPHDSITMAARKRLETTEMRNHETT